MEVAGAVPVASMGVGVSTVAHRRKTVTRLTVFDSVLTAQNSKFHIGTRISAKIEVVEDKMIYNFVFWHNLV